jgi:2-amino-4-hydroxy-6-hydroxymethyldihydropteridine diphosphokinase
MGPADQPDYVNAVAGLLTRLTPPDLLSELLGIERHMGRRRQSVSRWGPRVIDLDLLLYGDRIIDTRNLSVPHPGISERNFVLFPLLDIAPELAIPGQGKVSTMAGGLDSSALQRIG